MSRSRELHDRHGGQPAFGQAGQSQVQQAHGQHGQPAHGRGVLARPHQQQPQADAGPALPWQNQDAPAAPQPQAYPDPSQGYYQHDPYAQQQHPQHGYYAQDPYAQPQGGDAYYGHYFQPGQQQPPQASPPQATGYYQGQPHPGAYPQQGQGYVDPRTGYDLGNYSTQPPPRTQPPPHGQGYAAAPPPPQGYDPNAYAQQQQPGHNAEHEHEDDYHEYEDEEVEEPKSRVRTLFVVASLIGAIALGAGLAYGYKKFGGGGQAASNPPVMKASTGQSKVRADGTDGRKVSERLDGPAPAVVPARVTEAPPPAGPRVVQTIPVAPNGTLIAPPQAPQQVPQQVAAPAPLRPTISVPGMAVDNLPPPQAVAAAVPPPQPQAPQIISAPAGRAVAPPPPAAAPVEKAPVQKAAKAAAAVAPPAAVAATPAPRAANGYVAVLSSQGSRIEALKAYADLQQKYNSVLGGKPADVQEATVNGKVWYRAVVGPPGSRNAAADLCAQLKTAGHSACFPAAY